MGAMEFAKTAMGAEGEIARLLDDGACPFTGRIPTTIDRDPVHLRVRGGAK